MTPWDLIVWAAAFAGAVAIVALAISFATYVIRSSFRTPTDRLNGPLQDGSDTPKRGAD